MCQRASAELLAEVLRQWYVVTVADKDRLVVDLDGHPLEIHLVEDSFWRRLTQAMLKIILRGMRIEENDPAAEAGSVDRPL